MILRVCLRQQTTKLRTSVEAVGRPGFCPFGKGSLQKDNFPREGVVPFFSSRLLSCMWQRAHVGQLAKREKRVDAPSKECWSVSTVV